jgi:hypothetical protein
VRLLTTHLEGGQDVKTATQWVLTAVLGFSSVSPALGASIVLSFQGLKEGEQVQDYYNGGLGSMNSGPGPVFGATFTADAFVLTDVKHYSMEPTVPEVMLLGDNSVPGGQQIAATMNVAGGFVSDFSFYYGSIESSDTPQFVKIYSGLNGLGTQLASIALTMTPGSSANAANPQAVFTALPVDVPFAGTAHSVVFTGGNQQIVFDNIQFTAVVPEPTSVVLFALGFALLFAFCR